MNATSKSNKSPRISSNRLLRSLLSTAAVRSVRRAIGHRVHLEGMGTSDRRAVVCDNEGAPQTKVMRRYTPAREYFLHATQQHYENRAIDQLTSLYDISTTTSSNQGRQAEKMRSSSSFQAIRHPAGPSITPIFQEWRIHFSPLTEQCKIRKKGSAIDSFTVTPDPRRLPGDLDGTIANPFL